jgi:hypothetical protein
MADYAMWRKTQGTMATPSTGADGDGDGTIDQDDYNVWRAHSGQTQSSAAGSRSFVAPTAIADQL